MAISHDSLKEKSTSHDRQQLLDALTKRWDCSPLEILEYLSEISNGTPEHLYKHAGTIKRYVERISRGTKVNAHDYGQALKSLYKNGLVDKKGKNPCRWAITEEGKLFLKRHKTKLEVEDV